VPLQALVLDVTAVHDEIYGFPLIDSDCSSVVAYKRFEFLLFSKVSKPLQLLINTRPLLLIFLWLFFLVAE